MYEERASTIPGAVVWRAATAGPGRILPDGCMDLIWMQGEVVVAGPDNRPYEAGCSDQEAYVGLRFAPGALPELLRVHAAELANTRVPLADLLGDRAVRPLTARLEAAAAPGGILEAFPATQADPRTPSVPTGEAAPLVSEVVRLLDHGAGVATVAERVGLSARQLHRLSLSRFGYGPKMFASILRFQRALRLADAEESAATVALRAGYADQAHLIRETRRLADTTFGGLVGA